MDPATRRGGRWHRWSCHCQSTAVRRQFNTTEHSARHGGAPHCDGDTPTPIDSRADSQPLERRNRNTNPHARRSSVNTTAANACGGEGRLTHTYAHACGYEGRHVRSHANAGGRGDGRPLCYVRSGSDGRADSYANCRSGSDGRAHSYENGCGSRSVR